MQIRYIPMKLKKINIIFYVVIFLLGFAIILISMFKLARTEDQLIILSNYLQDNYPQVIQSNIGGDRLLIDFLKGIIVGIGLCKNLLQLGAILIIIVFLIPVLCKNSCIQKTE
jgi:hypothetical protein